MSADYKTMSRDKVLDQLDLIPGWEFWRESSLGENHKNCSSPDSCF